MSRQKLIEEVKRAGGAMATGAATQAVDAVLNGIVRLAEQGETVQLRGFGSFKIKERAGRTGRHPQTGETIQISPRRVLAFTDRRKV